MPSTELITAVVVMVVCAVLAAAAFRSGGELDVAAQTYTMRHGALLKVGLALLLVVTAAVGSLPLFVERIAWDFAAVFATLPLLLAVPVAIEQRSIAVWSPDGLRTRSLWRGEHRLAWADLQRVTFSKLLGWFTLHGRNGERMHVSGLYEGAPLFAQFLATHEPDCGAREAVTRWREALGRHGIGPR